MLPVVACCELEGSRAGSACHIAYEGPALAGFRLCPIRPLCPVMVALMMR